ncbi:hypothetical protein FBU30_005259 [Linnemannia zychae]|nr:hypothetical protein FBU30_005259 [Linnemannia zychae]
MTVSTSILEDVSPELSNTVSSKPHFREEQDQDAVHRHSHHNGQYHLSDSSRRTHRLTSVYQSRKSDEDVPTTNADVSLSPPTHRNHSQHFPRHSDQYYSPERSTPTYSHQSTYNSRPVNIKHERSHSLDNHIHQHHDRLHQRDDSHADRESNGTKIPNGNSNQWGTHHERGVASEHSLVSKQSFAEENQFDAFNRHFESDQIQGNGDQHHRHNQNHQNPSMQYNGQLEENGEFDEIVLDDNNHEEDVEEEEDDEEDGSEENDEDNPNSKERDASTTNEDGSCSLTFSMYHNQKPVKVRSMFVDKLFKMVEDPAIQHLISWAKEGDMFYVYNCVELSESILPRFFKHNNWQSFVRQLNMYGFHKIYRYDREESTLNRKRPESQRWQFYHPQFQRDYPHLRANIKRKSARSLNTAPATSRVVFEHGKGYFLQRNDRSRSNSGDGAPLPPTGAPHMQGRHFENGSSMSRHTSAGRPLLHSGSPRDRENRGETMALPGYQRQNHQSDERYILKTSSTSPHTSHDHPHQIRLPSSGYNGTHPSSDPRDTSPVLSTEEKSVAAAAAAMSHLRNHSVANKVTYEKGSLYALGADAASPVTHSHHHNSSASRGSHRGPENALSPLSTNGPGFGQSHHSQASPHRPPGYHHHGSVSDGLPMSSSTSPRGSRPTGHPSEIHVGEEHTRPYPITSSPHLHPQHPQQSYYNQHHHHHELHQRGRLHSMGGGPIPKDLPRPIPPLPSGSNFNTPHAPLPLPQSSQPHPRSATVGSPSMLPSSATAIIPPLSGPASTPSLKGAADPYVIIKELEHRLHSVEEAYMSLRQHTQKLQHMQVSQDRTIGWMRERIEQMTDAAIHGRRDSITSPLTPQSTTSFSGSKRRAEPSLEDARTRPRYENTALPPSGSNGGHIQSPDMRTFERGRGHGRHESLSGSHPPQNQQHQQHALPSPQAGPYPRLLTNLGRVYS